MARGNRRWGRFLLIFVLVAIMALIVADRVGVLVADHEVASQVKAQLAAQDITANDDPSVSVRGFPFLTQVLSGHYDEIDIVVPGLSSHGIRMDSLRVVATGVDAPASTVMSDEGQVVASKVVGTGEIAWASFEQMVDLSGLQQYGVDPSTLTITGADDGTITLSAPVAVAGKSITATAAGTLAVANDVVHVKIGKISANESAIPAAVQTQLQAIAQQLTFDVRIPALPYNLRLESVHATSKGIAITADASDVVLGG